MPFLAVLIPLLPVIIPAVSSIGLTIAGNAAKKNSMLPQCQKDCKTTCKSKHGFFLSGRRKCIKACRAKCVSQGANMDPTPEKKGINWWYVGAGIAGVVALIVIIYMVSRKK